MTKVLDVLEAFLNYHGYVYLRLDGSTRYGNETFSIFNLKRFPALFVGN